jgi:hypothetical protein
MTRAMIRAYRRADKIIDGWEVKKQALIAQARAGNPAAREQIASQYRCTVWTPEMIRAEETRRRCG